MAFFRYFGNIGSTEQDTSGSVAGAYWYLDIKRRIIAENFIIPLVVSAYNVLQHEESQLYYCSDHDPGYFKWCVMSYTWGLWFTREWFNECKNTIQNNMYRF